MTRTCPEQLPLAIAIAALLLLFGGAPLVWALPGGLLVWLSSRRSQWISDRLKTFLFVLVALYPIFIGVVQVSYWRAGQQGLDFGIFSQLIYQVAHNDQFLTSLIATEWQNFITHHFSPFLLLLGGVAKMGSSPESVLIAAHVLAVATLTLGLWKIFTAQTSPGFALVLTGIALLLPGVRRALGWETHDEVLALPFIIFSLVAHLTGRDTVKLLLLFPLLIFKETFGIVMCTTALAYAVDGNRRTSSPTARRESILVALFGMLFFLALTQVFPKWLWWPTFDPMSRLASWERLVDPELLFTKVLWLLFTALPSVPFLFLHSWRTVRVSLVVISPALYNFGAIMVSDFPAMIDPYSYYAITPAILLFLACSYPVIRSPRFSWALLGSLCLVVALGNTVRTSETVRAGFSAPSAYKELRTFVPQRANVIVDDYTSSVLADNSSVLRVFHARRSRTSFDFIVISKSVPDPLSQALKERSTVCHETPRYIIRCSADSVGLKNDDN
jgi:uncharacterized membrane protein